MQRQQGQPALAHRVKELLGLECCVLQRKFREHLIELLIGGREEDFLCTRSGLWDVLWVECAGKEVRDEEVNCGGIYALAEVLLDPFALLLVLELREVAD